MTYRRSVCSKGIPSICSSGCLPEPRFIAPQSARIRHGFSTRKKKKGNNKTNLEKCVWNKAQDTAAQPALCQGHASGKHCSPSATLPEQNTGEPLDKTQSPRTGSYCSVIHQPGSTEQLMLLAQTWSSLTSSYLRYKKNLWAFSSAMSGHFLLSQWTPSQNHKGWKRPLRASSPTSDHLVNWVSHPVGSWTIHERLSYSYLCQPFKMLPKPCSCTIFLEMQACS